jgi:hypothetical protein
MISKMFEDYAEERGMGPRLFHTDFGFITFHLHPSDNECYIEDLYVIPSERNKKHASHKLADEVCTIAKSKGITNITGSINKQTNNVELSRLVLIGYGMTKIAEDELMEWYIKEI